jgi:transposase
VEQRHQAVLEVLRGACVTEVARRYGVTCLTVNRWQRPNARSGIAGLASDSSRPASWPQQMPPAVEARIVEPRRVHPGWRPRTIAHYLGREQVGRLPSRSSICGCLVRRQLVDPQKERRKREDYRRWERYHPKKLCQIDVMGGGHLHDERELKLVRGLDFQSGYGVSAKLVERATAPGLRGLSRRDGLTR